MTEIKVQKRKPVWPWVLLILLILGILVYLFVYDDYNEEVDGIDHVEENDTGVIENNFEPVYKKEG